MVQPVILSRFQEDRKTVGQRRRHRRVTPDFVGVDRNPKLISGARHRLSPLVGEGDGFLEVFGVIEASCNGLLEFVTERF